MPAVRGTYLINPNTAEVGFWVELSTSSPGTLTGLARTAWPSTAGRTIPQYQGDLQTAYRALFRLAAIGPNPYFGAVPVGHYLAADGRLYPLIVDVVFTVASLGPPVTLTEVEVREGAIRLRMVT